MRNVIELEEREEDGDNTQTKIRNNNQKDEEDWQEKDPHYFQLTEVASHRKDLVQITLANNAKGKRNAVLPPSYTKEEAREIKNKASFKRKEVFNSLSIDEHNQNVSILSKMKQKLSFLRNPRFKKKFSSSNNKNKAILNTSDVMNTSLEEIPTNSQQLDFFSADQVGFSVQPKKCFFSDYEIGKTYTFKMSLRNISGVSKRINILPTSTNIFCLSCVKLPGDSGIIAPGLSCEVIEEFRAIDL